MISHILTDTPGFYKEQNWLESLDKLTYTVISSTAKVFKLTTENMYKYMEFRTRMR